MKMLTSPDLGRVNIFCIFEGSDQWYFEPEKGNWKTGLRLILKCHSLHGNKFNKSRTSLSGGSSPTRMMTGRKKGYPDGEGFGLPCAIVESYERGYGQMAPPEPNDALLFRMGQMNQTKTSDSSF